MKQQFIVTVEIPEETDLKEAKKAIFFMLDNSLDTGALRDVSDLTEMALYSVELPIQIPIIT